MTNLYDDVRDFVIYDVEKILEKIHEVHVWEEIEIFVQICFVDVETEIFFLVEIFVSEMVIFYLQIFFLEEIFRL